MSLRSGVSQKSPLNEFRENPRPEWFYQMPMKKGGGGKDVTYTIDSITVKSSGPYIGLTAATVTIEGTTPSIASLIGTSAEIIDHSGCVFNRDEADLIGVFGWATERIYKSLEAGHTDELTDPHWDADDRCCVAGEGG